MTRVEIPQSDPGKMADLTFAFDWATTPLGPAEAWPQSLKTVVDVMLASGHAMCLAWGPERTLLYNDGYAPMLGRRHPGALGRPLRDAWPDVWEEIAPLVSQVFAGETVRFDDMPLWTTRHGYSEQSWWTFSYSPVRNEAGAIAGLLNVTADTTPKVRAERALQESEERHRLLVGNWGQAMWETNAEGVVVADSPSWRAYTGQTLDEWLGHGWLDAIHPDDRAYAERQWREAMAARRPVDAEFRLRASAGGWRWTNVRAVPLLRADGRIEKWAGINIDIDAVKRAEAALVTSERRLQLTLRATGLGAYEWDLVTDTIFSDERFKELTALSEPLTGARILAGAVHRDDRDWIEADLNHAMQATSDGRFAVEHRLATSGPLGERWVLSHGQVIFTETGGERRPVRVFGTLLDISDRRNAEAEARQREERRAFLLELGDAVRPLAGPADIQGETTRLLRERLCAGWCYYVDWDLDRMIGLVLRDSAREGLSSLAGEHDVSDAPEFLELLASGEVLMVRDYANYDRLSPRIREKFVALGFRSMLATPLIKDGRLIATLLAGDTEVRDWSANEAALLVEVAERTWSAVERGRAEVELRETEARHRKTLEIETVGVVYFDFAGAISDANDTFLAMIGYSRAELTAGEVRYENLTPLEWSWRNQQTIEELQTSGRSGPFEKECLRRDGSRMWILCAATKLDDRYAVEFVIDVTDRKRATEDLRESEQALASDLANAERLRGLSERLVSEERFQAIYDEILSATIAITGADAGTVQIYDPATKSLELIASQNLSATITDYFQRVEVSSHTACGIALETGERTFVDFPDEVEDFGCQLLAGEGIRSAVAFPLLSRTGVPLGMLNAHWRGARHRLDDRELRFLDLLARQAADLIYQRRSRSALRESEARFRLAIEGSKIALYECGLDLRYTWIANPVEGWRDAEIVGYTDEELLPPEYAAPLMDFKRRALAADGPLEEEMLGAPAGRPQWFLMRAEKLVGSRGEVSGLRVLALDIDELKRSTQALRESEERLRQFGEASQDVLWMREPATLQWTYLTPAFEAIYGTSRDQALGGDDYRNWLDLVVPEDRAHAAACIERVRAGENVTFEYRIRRPDGAIRWLRDTDFPIRDATGKVALIGGIGQDITILKQAETARRESEQRLRLIVENARDYAIFTIDPDGVCTDWREGAEAVFGYTRAEMIGQDFRILYTPEDREKGEAEKELATAVAQDRAPDVRWHMRKGDVRVFIDGVSTALRGTDGTLLGFLKIGHDVTERHAGEERQKVLLAELQHRVRNILAVIRSMVSRSDDGERSTEDYVAHLQGRISALARTQVLLTRAAGKTVDLELLIREEIVAQAASEDRIEFHGEQVSISPKAAEVLTLAVHELATNATKYGAFSRPSGHLSVHWHVEQREDRNWLMLRWREHGVAIVNAAPLRQGFGFELITRRIPYELKGHGTVELMPGGIESRIEFPLIEGESILETDAGGL